MASPAAVVALAVLALLAGAALAADPYAYFDWDVSYITASPLGVPQKVLLLLTIPISSSTLHLIHYALRPKVLVFHPYH